MTLQTSVGVDNDHTNRHNHHEVPMDELEVNRTARAIKAMSHPLRLKLLCILGDNEMSVQHLTREVKKTSQSNVSQHLSRLLERGVLSNRRMGNQVLYRVRDPQVLTLLNMIDCVFCDDNTPSPLMY